MKKLLSILVVVLLFFNFSTDKKLTENISFFDGATFTLEYFVVNGTQQNLDITDVQGNQNRAIPTMSFTFNTTTNQLEVSIGGYCNTSSAKYIDNGSSFEVIERGGTTLADCGTDEEPDYFTPITGNYYSQQPAESVIYEITANEQGLWLWMHANHKLYFSKNVLSTEESEFKKAVSVFPNPAENQFEIQLKGTQFLLSEIKIVTLQGKTVLTEKSNFNKIDVSILSSGIYFLKIKSTEKLQITKKILIK